MPDIAVFGARGYLGRELVRLLWNHPNIDNILPISSQDAGQPYGASVPGFSHTGLRTVSADQALEAEPDVVFFATPGGVAKQWAPSFRAAGAKAIIDLSRDHRQEAIAGGDWHYGLADVNPTPKGTVQVANPGCYPTASLLALAPALSNNLVGPGPIIVDGKSGVSGAGVQPQASLHFPEMNESVRAYKVLGHDHQSEIQACAGTLNGHSHKVRFTPHLVPQTRGLLSTVYAPAAPGVDQQTLRAMYEKAYSDSSFVSVVDEADTRHVRGTNRAQVAVDLDEDAGIIVARGAIDNLVKGGSGTAIQNLNHILGIDETTGLDAIGGTI